MKGPRLRIQAAALSFMLLPAAAGVVAVRASATCEKFVKTYVTKPVRNRVSKTTAEAWAAWRVAHPNWKPNPNLHRPKYVMNRQESIQKVEFACSVPLLDTVAEGLFVPVLPPPIVNFRPMQATQLKFPDEVPPEVAELTPQETWPPLEPYVPPIVSGGPTPGGVPVFPPGGPGTIETAEPGSLMLAGTGMAFAFVMLVARIRRQKLAF